MLLTCSWLKSKFAFFFVCLFVCLFFAGKWFEDGRVRFSYIILINHTSWLYLKSFACQKKCKHGIHLFFSQFQLRYCHKKITWKNSPWSVSQIWKVKCYQKVVVHIPIYYCHMIPWIENIIHPLPADNVAWILHQ